MQKTPFFSQLKKERNFQKNLIETHNFDKFLAEFDLSQKKTPVNDPHLQDLENLLIEKAHNLRIYHDNSSAKEQINPNLMKKTAQNSKKFRRNEENLNRKNCDFCEEKIEFSHEKEAEFFAVKEAQFFAEKDEEFFAEKDEEFFAEKDAEFFAEKEAQFYDKENFEEISFAKNKGNSKEIVWKRLQDDRAAEKLQRELLRKHKEEQILKENCTFKPKLCENFVEISSPRSFSK